MHLLDLPPSLQLQAIFFHADSFTPTTVKLPLVIDFISRKYYMETDGIKLDLGAYTKALEYACDCKATVVGKPSADYFNVVLKHAGASPQEVSV